MSNKNWTNINKKYLKQQGFRLFEDNYHLGIGYTHLIVNLRRHQLTIKDRSIMRNEKITFDDVYTITDFLNKSQLIERIEKEFKKRKLEIWTGVSHRLSREEAEKLYARAYNDLASDWKEMVEYADDYLLLYEHKLQDVMDMYSIKDLNGKPYFSRENLHAKYVIPLKNV